MHLCAELIAVSMTLEPLGEVGANFSQQLSSRTQFTKINNKKVIAEDQCEKHKKSSLVGLTIACVHDYMVVIVTVTKIYGKMSFNRRSLAITAVPTTLTSRFPTTGYARVL